MQINFLPQYWTAQKTRVSFRYSRLFSCLCTSKYQNITRRYFYFVSSGFDLRYISSKPRCAQMINFHGFFSLTPSQTIAFAERYSSASRIETKGWNVIRAQCAPHLAGRCIITERKKNLHSVITAIDRCFSIESDSALYTKNIAARAFWQPTVKWHATQWPHCSRPLASRTLLIKSFLPLPLVIPLSFSFFLSRSLFPPFFIYSFRFSLFFSLCLPRELLKAATQPDDIDSHRTLCECSPPNYLSTELHCIFQRKHFSRTLIGNRS